MFNLTPAAKNILIINVIIFFLTSNYIIEEFGLRYLLSLDQMQEQLLPQQNRADLVQNNQQLVQQKKQISSQ